MLNEKRPCPRDYAVELHHDRLRKNFRLLLVLGAQGLLEPRNALLGSTQQRGSCRFERLGHLRRTW